MKKYFVILFVLAFIAPVFAAYHFDKCLQINGPLSQDDQYIQITPNNPDLYNFTGNFTVEFWFYIDPALGWTNGDHVIVSNWSFYPSYTGWAVNWGSLPQLQFKLGQNTAYSSYVFGYTGWIHVAAVKNISTLDIYFNGELDTSTPYTPGNFSNDLPLRIGEYYDIFSEPLKGRLDEVRIWQYARNANQIKYNRYNKMPGTEAGLVTYLPLNNYDMFWPYYPYYNDLTGNTTGYFYGYSEDQKQNATQLEETYSGDKAYDFSNGNPQVQFGNLWNFATQFTAEAWIKPSVITPVGEPRVILQHSVHTSIMVLGDEIRAQVGMDSGPMLELSYFGIKPGQWYHIGLTVQANGLCALYINGLLVHSVTLGGTEIIPSSSNALWNIGNSAAGGASFQGLIDQVRIWDRALTASEIWTRRHQELIGSQTNLLVNYTFNETSNLVIFNRSGNINCLTNEAGAKVNSDWPKNGYYYAGTLTEDFTLPVRTITVWENISIPATRKLTVNPGTTLSFLGHYGILAEGSLQALGSATQKINFTVADTTGFLLEGTAGSWNGITIMTTAESDSTIINHSVLKHAKAEGVALHASGVDALSGGALCLKGTSRARISNSLFSNNRASLDGGAIYSEDSHVILAGNTVTGNAVGSVGGGLAFRFTSGSQYPGTIVSNLITGNIAGTGGGILFQNCTSYPGDPVTDGVRNNTIADNHAREAAGGIGYLSSSLRTRNSIIWGNTSIQGNQIAFAGTDPGFLFCNIHGGEAGIFADAGSYSGVYESCIDIDPEFADGGIHPYALNPWSPCINRGEEGSALGEYDVMGNPRVFDDPGGVNAQIDEILDRIDLGAYEDQSTSGVVPYDVSLSGTMTLGHNLTVPHGSTLSVPGGTNLQFAAQTGLDVRGSLQAPGTAENWIAFTAQNEALGWDGLAFLGENTEADSAYVSYSLISHASTGTGDPSSGGLIHVDGYEALNVSNCVLSNGSASKGGALAVLDSSAEFYNCELHHNVALEGGGAVYLENASPLLAHLSIVENSSFTGAGAILATGSDYARVFGCNIWDNGSTPLSGAMNVLYSNVQGGWDGSSNIDADPRFDPAHTEHYILSPTSPCLNRGIPDPDNYPDLPGTDIQGGTRIHAHTEGIFDRPDIGADEYPGILDPADFTATDGDNNYPGQVNLSWSYSSDYLPNDGFQVFRDGSLLVTLFPHINSYADYSAIPGQQHAYTLLAYAGGETSEPITDTGYIKPNGIITGKVETPNGNPVSGVSITLDPSLGSCLQFGPDSWFEVEVPVADLGASFTLEAWVKTSGADFTLIGKTDSLGAYLRELRIAADGRLSYTDGISTLAQQTGTPALNDGAWHHAALAYDAPANMGYLYLDGTCVADSSIAFTDIPGGIINIGDPAFTGYLDDLRLWDSARSGDDIQYYMNLVPAWNSPGLAGYWAMNEGSGTKVFDATNNASVATTNAAWSEDEPGVMLGGVTDNWGEYVVSQIPYGNYTTFTVIPVKPGHMFQPEQRLVTLSQSNISADNVDFIDNSLIPISGHVRFYGTDCPVQGATIWLNGSQAVPIVMTDSGGYYVLEVEHGTPCVVSMDYLDHTFDREWDLGPVTYPRSGIDFEDTFTTDLFVQVAGGPDSYPIGEFDVSLNSVDGLFTREITGEDWYTGMILIPYVPPLDLNVTVDPAGDDPFNLVVDDQFQSLKTQHLDLTHADATADTLRYEWRAPLQAEVAWPAGLELKYFSSDPQQEYGFYVLEQNEWVELEIGAYEDYTIPGFPERRSWLTDCGIHISDDVGAIAETEAELAGAQTYLYSFAPYLPNILSGGERPYQNMLEVTLHDPGLERLATRTDWVLTQGARPTQNTFSTTSPEIPFLILHDPPGDASYASFRESSSHSVAMGVSYSSLEMNGAHVISHLGPDIVSDVGILYSVQTSFDIILDIAYGYSVQVTQGDAYETSLTFTTTEEYKTSDQGSLIGRESDLYVGGAVNLIWGMTRELAWNDTTQTASLEDGVMVIPNGFDTVYMYTEAQILNNVIPNLYAIGDSTSAAMWQSYVDMNSDNIANAEENANHPTNLSFNAGAGYLYEETSASSSSHTFTFDTLVSETFGADIGLVVNGLGVEGGYSFESALTIGSSTTDTYATETSISYELADDDETSYLNFQPDYFTVDVKKDPVYGTPVFDLLAGASSNRWEASTMPRDGVSFSANTYTASGLQEGDTAAFLLNLGNTSQTGEHRRYFLTLRHETNPGGAVVKINGLPLTDRMAFNVPPGEQVQAVMTVEMGAGDYECEGLTLEFFAEGDRGHDGPDGHDFWVTRPFNIYWEPPYSRVEILQPEEGWIINQACANQMEVMLAGYDAEIPDLFSLLLQYKHPADTNWLPALDIPRDSLLAHPQYITALWDVSALSDGSYQIRACASHALQGDHYSPALLGMIDRASPEIWGIPQPADGILQPGDLISATFTETIDPNSLEPGNVLLTVLRTGMAVDADAQVSGNQLSIVPAVANYWLENETLQVTLSSLVDMYGNPLAEPVMWEFFVNANPVYWTQPKIEVIKALGEPLSLGAQLHNSGGQFSSFGITDLPQWLTASPDSGDLLPLETQDISFEVSSQLGYGVFRDTIFADIPGLGREPLVFEVSVLADPPAWASTPLGDFAYSMNITGQLFLEGALSTDTDDVIGAFCWDEAVSGFCLRGAASLVSLPLGEGSHEFFLTVYSDTETGVPLHFRVWDSSENKEHFGIEEEFVFSSEAIYGTPLEPIVIHPEPELYFARPCSAGWNWLSVNLENATSMDLDDVLASLEPSDGDIVKGQASYAQYVTGLGWVGDLESVSTLEAYKLNISQPGDMATTGLLADPQATPVPHASGWNWIGYLPHVSLGVNEALGGLASAGTGDLVKGRNAYAQYIPGEGWFGSLLFLSPGEGYMLKTAGSGSFYYPDYEIPREEPADAYAIGLERLRDPSGWTIDPADYEFTSNITCAVLQNGVPLDQPDALLGAFYGDECRGLAAPVWVVDKWVFFLTQYSNAQDQILSYKVYLAGTGEIFTAAESLPFINNQVLGDPVEPFQFNIGSADLAIPQNLLMELSAGSLTLGWDESSGASSYLVFASDSPEGPYTDVTSLGVFGSRFLGENGGKRVRITWTAVMDGSSRKFYRVRASTAVRHR